MTDKIPYDTRQNIRQPYYDKEYRPTIKVDNKQITDLFNLVGNMNINEVKQFMIIEQIPYSVVDNNNNTLIHRVLLDNDLSKTEIQRLQMIKFLFNENVNPDGPNYNNLTPLHIACSKQFYHIIKYLIEIGVDVNYQDNFGNTPLHRLFSGGIKIEEKTTIGNLIPKPKKKDSVNTAKWILERAKIWEDINSSPFIKAIDNTLQNSIGSDEDEINVVSEFQQQLLQMNLKSDTEDEIKKIKDLQAASITRFTNIIEKRWGMLPSIEDIIIHPTAADSFPSDDPSKLAIIKKANTIEYIRGTLYNKIRDIISLLQNFNDDDLKFDLDAINTKLLEDYLNANPKCLIPENMLTDHVPHYNNYNNKFKHNASFDFADNIIDTDAKTFIGGVRNILINNNVNNTTYQELFNKPIEHIIPIILYTLVTDFNTAKTFNGTFNILSGQLSQHEIIIELLYDIINNNLTKEKIILFKNNTLFQSQPYLYLHNLLDNLKPDTNIIGWIYCFINNYVCGTQFIRSDVSGSNLNGTIPLSVIYLIAGMINNKGGKPENLILSISQSMRKSLYINIFNEANNIFGFLNMMPPNNLLPILPILPGCLISALIYLIFAIDYKAVLNNITNALNPDNINEYQPLLFNKIDGFNESDEFKFIMKYSYLVMNNIPIPNDINIPTIYNNLDPREILVSMISKYYNSMEQPPQMQMVADIIDLIRKKKDNDEVVNEELIINRFRHFIQITVIDINNIPANPADIINPNLNNMIANMNASKYFKIIGDNLNASKIWNITNNSLPSRVNYYLSLPLPDDNNRENLIMYTLKFIESYYLGLNFLGQTQPLQIINNMNIDGAVLDTNYNLFNFDNHLDESGNIELTNFQLFYTNTNPNLNRPTTIMSVINTLLHIETNLNKLIYILVQKLLFVFTRMDTDKATSLYSTAISYLYPDLLILTNYSKIFESINKTFESSYAQILEEINESTNIDINDNLTNFRIFRLNRFQSIINQINGYIYLLHYFTSTTPIIKIPSFIYHTLGNDKPLVIFDADLNILKPESDIPGVNINTNINTVTTEYDKMKGHINRDIGFFSNVINNIGYTTKQTLKRHFIISKNKKLPPSLSIVLTDFYRLNIIETIKNNKTNIDNSIVNANINPSNKNIQLLYLKSKIIEELIKLYIKNKIHEYARDIYTKLISNPIFKISETQKLFDTVDFSVDLNKQPSKDFINNLTIATQSGLKLYYSFVEPKKIKQQFYIYPDNYFGSNLLKTKYTININLDIIELMLQNNCNILLHNNEKLSPLVMMIKNYYYEAFNIIKNNFDMNSYDNNNYNSPQYYLMENFKNHLDNYYKKISESQYTEMINIIQSNESYNNNILKYMDVSFNVVKYIVHQYLTENMLRFSDDFDSNSLNQLLILLGFNVRDINNIGKCHYNENLGSNIIIPNADEGIIINEIKQEINTKINESKKLLAKYSKEKTEIVGLNMNTTNIDSKIFNITNKIEDYENQLTTLNKFNFFILNPFPDINYIKIINRYEDLRNRIGKISYMEGWKQFLKQRISDIDQLSFYLIMYQNSKDKSTILNINTIHKFYKHNNNIIKTYFENQRYIDDNKVLGFVYDLLVHLTKTFICSNISSIIKKILYEYIISTQNIPINMILDQINVMVTGIDDVLYNIIPQKFVRNSVNIYYNEDDEAANPIETVSEILNNLIDLLKTSSYININDYTINILKNSINPYFDTITYKLINNWNVVIENIFLFHINQYRILECIIQLYN